MNNPDTQHLSENKTDISKFNHFILAAFSLCMLIATFLAANSSLGFQAKIIVFLFIVFLYLFGCAAFYFLQKRRLSLSLENANAEISAGVFTADVETKLLALEEANEFFGASLKSADMFQLVSSRIREIIPFASSALFLVSEDNTQLKAAFADGENAEGLAQLETDFYKGLAGKTFVSQKSQFDDELLLDKSAVSSEALKNLNSAVSVPLFRDAEVFGVLMLYENNNQNQPKKVKFFGFQENT